MYILGLRGSSYGKRVGNNNNNKLDVPLFHQEPFFFTNIWYGLVTILSPKYTEHDVLKSLDGKLDKMVSVAMCSPK